MLCIVVPYVIPTLLKLKLSKCQKTSIEVLFDKKRVTIWKLCTAKLSRSIVIYSQSFYLYINKKEKETVKKRPTFLKYCKVSRCISSIQIAFWLQNCQYMIYVWEQSFISAFSFYLTVSFQCYIVSNLWASFLEAFFTFFCQEQIWSWWSVWRIHESHTWRRRRSWNNLRQTKNK